MDHTPGLCALGGERASADVGTLSVPGCPKNPFSFCRKKATMRQVGEADIDALQEVDHN